MSCRHMLSSDFAGGGSAPKVERINELEKSISKHSIYNSSQGKGQVAIMKKIINKDSDLVDEDAIRLFGSIYPLF